MSDWIESLGRPYSDYAPYFASQNAITLVALSVEDLKELCIPDDIIPSLKKKLEELGEAIAIQKSRHRKKHIRHPTEGDGTTKSHDKHKSKTKK